MRFHLLVGFAAPVWLGRRRFLLDAAPPVGFGAAGNTCSAPASAGAAAMPDHAA